MGSNSEKDEIESILNRETSEYAKDVEINRILNTFKLDAYAILDLLPGCTVEDIKAQYRKKSLLIHPDRTKNLKAPDAFNILKKASQTLENDKERKNLDECIADARRLLIRDKKWDLSDERLKSDDFLKEWREKSKELLVDEELRKRRILKAKLKEEGRQRRKEEEEIASKKLKKDFESSWEATRDERIKGWRDYQKKSKKKKSKEPTVLG